MGDIHISLGYPNKTEKWLKVHKEYFDKFLIPLLEEKVEEGDIIVQLGDLFDNRDIIPIHLMNYAMDQVERISKIAPFHIIIGNHDCWSKSSDEINSVRPFKWIPNVFIYDKVSKIEHLGKKILFMPYIDKKKDQIRIINENKDCDYLFCHSDLNGAKMHLTSSGHKNLDKIDIDEFSGFDGVYSGHIHLYQRNNNFIFVGSIFQMDRNDYGNQKGITVLNIENGDDEFIPNLISPVFKKVKILKEDDIELLEELKGTKDYIDIEISNSLLISNRKLRRKLEVILEDGGFESIDYIDDITNELKEDEKITEQIENSMEKNEISIQLDYEEYIKEYINKQKYENDKFKDGIISEYDELIEIYKTNYKNE